MDGPCAPRRWASNGTVAANMIRPRASVRPRVPEPPAWRQNHRVGAGRACSALKIVQKCPLGLQWPPNCHGSSIFHATNSRFPYMFMGRRVWAPIGAAGRSLGHQGTPLVTGSLYGLQGERGANCAARSGT